MARGDFDRLGKSLMQQAAGSLYVKEGPSVSFSFGPEAGKARIDGTVAGVVAVEIESRALKQVRGALLDLLLHPYPKKLLLILPVYAGNAATAVKQAQAILGRFLKTDVYRVVCVTDDLEESIEAIRAALRELGVSVAAGHSKSTAE